MTNPRNVNNDLTKLLRHARRQLMEIRHGRQRYASPRQWSRVQGERLTERFRQHADAPRVDRASARLAAQWAVADARRDDVSLLARDLDLRVQAQGADIDALRRERDRALEASADAQQNGGANLVPIAAGLAVSAALFANAAEWDEMAPTEVESAMQSWEDPDLGDFPDVADADLDPDATEVATLPEDLFPYSIEEQLTHAQDNGAHIGEGGTPAPSADMGMDVQASPSMG